MNAFGLYLLKAVLCSGILLGYYWLALRNRTFHQWNRFYLLLSVLLSLIAPVVTLNLNLLSKPAPHPVLRLLRVVDGNAEVVVESNRHGLVITPEQMAFIGYTVISSCLLLMIVASAARIYAILRKHTKTKIGTVYFLSTEVEGTPFSFFKYIVWNRTIDLQSDAGQRIFKHELAHVTQRHTWDKVFLLLVLVPFWINPFFWLIRREIIALHEFAADKKALEQYDSSALAQMILNTVFPHQHLLFTNHFFQSTIKRRLAMFTKLQNPTVNYFSRIAALPLLLFVIASFATITNDSSKNRTGLGQPLTVVIDAGHGGRDGGAFQANMQEKAIVLAIAQKIKQQNKNGNIRILLTRNTDELIALKSRVQLSADSKADLFISVHINTASANATTPETGMQVMVSSKNPPYQQKSQAFGSLLVQEMAGIFITQQSLAKSGSGIYVIDQNTCPAVLLSCGSLSNESDRAFITQEKNQKLIAAKILDAIEQYGVLKNTGQLMPIDTLRRLIYENKAVADVQYFEWPEKRAEVTFSDNSKKSIPIEDAIKANLFSPKDKALIEQRAKTAIDNLEQDSSDGEISIRTTSAKEASRFTGTVVLDNNVTNATYRQLPLSEDAVSQMYFLKTTSATLLNEFGVQVKPNDSLLIINTKAFVAAGKQTGDDPLFTKTETEPTFPPEKGGWQAFLHKNLNADVPLNNGAPPGTYKTVVGFIVDNYGKLHNIKPITKLGYGMEEEVVRLLKTSPDWIPAKQKGKAVTAYKKQTVTYVIAEVEEG